MKILKYIGPQREEEEAEPLRPPSDEHLENLLREGLIPQFVREIVEWKDEVDYSYFERHWGVSEEEIDQALEELEDVEKTNPGALTHG